MVFTDPSGNSWWTKFRDKWVKPIVGIVVGVLVAIYAPQFLSSYFNLATGTLGSAVATGALAGAAGGAIMTGTLSGTLKGAAFGALSAGVANIIGHGSNIFARIARTGKTAKAILHGLSRAAISKLQSGSGKGGFLSGFAASFLGGTIAENFGNSHTIVKVSMAAIAGGTASALGGGKFSNGAMSGAFIMLFNELAYDRQAVVLKRARALLVDTKVLTKYKVVLKSLLQKNAVLYVDDLTTTASVGNTQKKAEFLGVTAADFSYIKIGGKNFTYWENQNNLKMIPYQLAHTILHEVNHVLLQNNGHFSGFDNEIGDMGYGYGY